MLLYRNFILPQSFAQNHEKPAQKAHSGRCTCKSKIFTLRAGAAAQARKAPVPIKITRSSLVGRLQRATLKPKSAQFMRRHACRYENQFQPRESCACKKLQRAFRSSSFSAAAVLSRCLCSAYIQGLCVYRRLSVDEFQEEGERDNYRCTYILLHPE